MKIRYVIRFKEQLRKLPSAIRKKFYKQAAHLVQNITYPSLHAKKYDETQDIWQARIDRRYRFYFKIKGDVYVLTELIKHTD